MTRGSRPGELHRRRVVLLAESAGLAAVLNHLLDPTDRLSRIGSLRELAESRALDSADVVVLDVPVEDRAAAVGQVRRRFLGALVVLVAKGDDSGGLRLDDAATLLTRPFSAEELGAALAVPGRPAGAGTARPTRRGAPSVPRPVRHAGRPDRDRAGSRAPLGTPVPPAGAAAVDVKAAARQAPVRRAPAAPPGQLDLVDRVQRLLITLTQGWQARRRVRVAGFSVFALVAFTVAFALAAQGGRCGPGCDAFGTVFSPGPDGRPGLLARPVDHRPQALHHHRPRPAPRDRRLPGHLRRPARPPPRTERRATTTTRKPTTTRPATTRPATTQPTTPTTAPTTTAAPTTTTTLPPAGP